MKSSDEILPTISVIIPVYNAGVQLERCLNSIFFQDYPKEKLEVLVKKILMGIPVEKAVNVDSMSNPESIQYFEKLAKELG